MDAAGLLDRGLSQAQPAGRGPIEGSGADNAKHALEYSRLRAAYLRRDPAREFGRFSDELIGEPTEDAVAL